MTQSRSGGGSRRRSTRTSQSSDDALRVKLVWREDVAATLPILQADQVFARYIAQSGEVILTFGHVELPLEVRATPETRQRLENEGVPVTPITRLAVTPQVLVDFVRHLNTIMEGINQTPTGQKRQTS